MLVSCFFFLVSSSFVVVLVLVVVVVVGFISVFFGCSFPSNISAHQKT